MCNDYRNRKSARRLVEDFSEIKIRLRFSNGTPNIEPRDDITITDPAPIILPDSDSARLEMMRWSWPSPKRGAGVQLPVREPDFPTREALPHSC
jgi:putative SOS response-associated peptidase YedK